jgi:hypothetical protein
MLDVCAFFESFQGASSCESRWRFWAAAAILPDRAKKMARKCGLAGLHESKGLQEQQFQAHFTTWNWRYLTLSGIKSAELEASSGYRAGEKIQSKGRIRKSLVFDALPVHPHRGLSQAISSSPKIFIASFSESAGSEHFLWKLILCPPLGHANTMRYALLIPKDNI